MGPLIAFAPPDRRHSRPALAVLLVTAGLVAAVLGAFVVPAVAAADERSARAANAADCRAPVANLARFAKSRAAAARRKAFAARRLAPGLATGIQARLRTRRGGDLRGAADDVRSSGARYTREDFTWGTIEPRKGLMCWGATDRWMAAAARRGLHVIAILDAPPAWATASWNTAPTSGAALDAYIRFTSQVIGRYGSSGSFWRENPGIPAVPIDHYDIWNEPYYERFWAGSVDPAAYAQMFRAVVRAARPVDPRAKFMLEAETTTLGPDGQQQPFLAAMFDAVPDLGRYADIASIHPYASNGWGPETCQQGPDLQARRLQVCRLNDIRAILDAHGAAGTRMWITELGWSAAAIPGGAVSDADQARFTRETYALLRGRWAGLVDGVVWYGYQTPSAGWSAVTSEARQTARAAAGSTIRW
jgi:hypothetical protein